MGTFTYTFRVMNGKPVATSRDELSIFGLAAHPGATGVYFLHADTSFCRRCLDGQRWLVDLDVEALDEDALVVFSPTMACDLCGSEAGR